MDNFIKTKVQYKRPLWTQYKASGGVFRAGTNTIHAGLSVYDDDGFQEAVIPAVFMFGAGIPAFVAPGVLAGAASVSVYVAGAVTFVAESLYSAVRLPIIALTDPKVKVNKALTKLKNGESSTLSNKAFNRLKEVLTTLGNKKLNTRVSNHGPDEMYFDLPKHPKIQLPIALDNNGNGSGACRLFGYDYAVDGSLLLSTVDQKSVIVNESGEVVKVGSAKSIDSVICKKDPMVTEPVCVVNYVKKADFDYRYEVSVADGTRIQLKVGSVDVGDQKGILKLLTSAVQRGLCNNGSIPAKCSMESTGDAKLKTLTMQVGKQKFSALMRTRTAEKIMDFQLKTGACY